MLKIKKIKGKKMFKLRKVDIEDFKKLLEETRGAITEKAHELADETKEAIETARSTFKEAKTLRGPATDIALDQRTKTMYIELAVPGFAKDTISIELEGNVLSLEGSQDLEICADFDIIESNIARREFSRTIVLSDAYKGAKVSASLTDGILLVTVVPVPKKSQKIEIK